MGKSRTDAAPHGATPHSGATPPLRPPVTPLALPRTHTLLPPQYWACNIHAFCYTCVDDTDTVDDYCKATVLHEKSLYAPSAVFDDLDDYWCEDTVLDKIADGTYCGWAKGQEGHKCV